MPRRAPSPPRSRLRSLGRSSSQLHQRSPAPKLPGFDKLRRYFLRFWREFVSIFGSISSALECFNIYLLLLGSWAKYLSEGILYISMYAICWMILGQSLGPRARWARIRFSSHEVVFPFGWKRFQTHSNFRRKKVWLTDQLKDRQPQMTFQMFWCLIRWLRNASRLFSYVTSLTHPFFAPQYIHSSESWSSLVSSTEFVSGEVDHRVNLSIVGLVWFDLAWFGLVWFGHI